MHPHLNYVGAFNAIWENLRNMEIFDFYTIKMDYSSCQEGVEE